MELSEAVSSEVNGLRNLGRPLKKLDLKQLKAPLTKAQVDLQLEQKREVWAPNSNEFELGVSLST